MDQHPIPQNISSYQFRLIGDMTLRQFFLLLGGGVVGYMFYITNLPGIIKWFFIFIAVLMGVAFAFLPLEGRPLDQWLMAFIKTVYAPTRFFWKKAPQLPHYLNNQSVKSTTQNVAPPTPLSTPKTLPDVSTPEIEKIDVLQNERLNQINQLFSQRDDSLPINNKVEQPAPLQHKDPASVPPNEVTTDPSPSPTPQKITIAPLAPVTLNPPPITLKPPTTTASDPSPHPTITNHQNPNQTTIDGSAAIFNPNLPFPSVSENPNTLMGMVTDHAGKIIENAVIEIKNATGTVRATKTNRLGQFFLATPLNDDSYQIEVEKTGLTFTPISIKLEGKIYPPLDIKAVD